MCLLFRFAGVYKVRRNGEGQKEFCLVNWIYF